MKKSLILRLILLGSLHLIWWLALPDQLKDTIELPLQDLLTQLQHKPANVQDPRIAIIDIDEASLSAEGRWPWPRNTIATLIEQLQNHYQVELIGSDIIFPDTNHQQDNLAKAITQASVTTTLLWHPEIIVRKGAWDGKARCDNCTNLPQAQAWITNTADLTGQQQAHITPEIDNDSRVRRLYPLVCHEDACIEMLALSLVRQILSLPPQYSQPNSQVLQHTSGLLQLPLLPDGSYPIPWHTQPGSISYYSATQVLNQQLHPEALRGKVVIIGSTATGLHDLVATPLAIRYPAVEIHALLFQSLLDNQHWQQPVNSHKITLLACLTLALSLLLADHRQQLTRSLPLLLLALAGWTLWVWQQRITGQLWPISPPFVTSLLTLFILLPLSLREQTRYRETLRQQFSAYVPSTVIDRLAKSPETAIGIHPQRHFVTVLFADLRHFSRFSEDRSPEQLASIMRNIMDELTHQVHHHGGTVDKYIGDAIMAFWGAPLANSHHADDAIQAAIAMCRSIDQFKYNNEVLPFQLSVGVNTGDVVVGDLGSSIRRSYTVLGSAVNIAAHIEEMTRQIDQPILVGEATYKLVSHQYEWGEPIERKPASHTKELVAYPLDPFK